MIQFSGTFLIHSLHVDSAVIHNNFSFQVRYIHDVFVSMGTDVLIVKRERGEAIEQMHGTRRCVLSEGRLRLNKERNNVRLAMPIVPCCCSQAFFSTGLCCV